MSILGNQKILDKAAKYDELVLTQKAEGLAAQKANELFQAQKIADMNAIRAYQQSWTPEMQADQDYIDKLNTLPGGFQDPMPTSGLAAQQGI